MGVSRLSGMLLPPMLTDTAIRNAKPREKPYKLSGGGGLYLLINPSDSRWWRLKYRVAGKEKLLSLGVYPEISLKQAHDRRDECRRQLANGIDPGVKRKVEKASEVDSFEAIAREWFEKFSANWAPTHSSKVIRRLEMDVFPWLGSRRARDIAPPELLTCLRRVESRGALDTAHRVLQNCGQIFRYAVATESPCASHRAAFPTGRRDLARASHVYW